MAMNAEVINLWDDLYAKFFGEEDIKERNAYLNICNRYIKAGIVLNEEEINDLEDLHRKTNELFLGLKNFSDSLYRNHEELHYGKQG